MWKTSSDGQVLHIFVEPMDRDRTEHDEKPIKQLDVSVQNFIDGALFRDHVLAELTEMKPCTSSRLPSHLNVGVHAAW